MRPSLSSSGIFSGFSAVLIKIYVWYMLGWLICLKKHPSGPLNIPMTWASRISYKASWPGGTETSSRSLFSPPLHIEARYSAFTIATSPSGGWPQEGGCGQEATEVRNFHLPFHLSHVEIQKSPQTPAHILWNKIRHESYHVVGTSRHPIMAGMAVPPNRVDRNIVIHHPTTDPSQEAGLASKTHLPSPPQPWLGGSQYQPKKKMIWGRE